MKKIAIGAVVVGLVVACGSSGGGGGGTGGGGGVTGHGGSRGSSGSGGHKGSGGTTGAGGTTGTGGTAGAGGSTGSGGTAGSGGTCTAATPPGTSFVGPGGATIDFGSACTGKVYYPDGSGWAYCVGGVWDYTTTDPSACGYVLAGGSDSGTCQPLGGTCSTASDCCTQPMGAACIIDHDIDAGGARCYAKCSTGSDCTSGCCSPVTGETYSVCANFLAFGATCTTPNQCCQGGSPHGATCANVVTSTDECTAICYHNSECTSGCCVQLTALTYGACGGATGHTCIP